MRACRRLWAAGRVLLGLLLLALDTYVWLPLTRVWERLTGGDRG